jgi:hypothetical protein
VVDADWKGLEYFEYNLKNLIASNKIEAMIGIKIFNRERNNTTPTPIGRKIIEKCQEIMIHFKDLEKISANAKNIEVKIGIIKTLKILTKKDGLKLKITLKS